MGPSPKRYSRRHRGEPRPSSVVLRELKQFCFDLTTNCVCSVEAYRLITTVTVIASIRRVPGSRTGLHCRCGFRRVSKQFSKLPSALGPS
jgi:hypothetical protein